MINLGIHQNSLAARKVILWISSLGLFILIATLNGYGTLESSTRKAIEEKMERAKVRTFIAYNVGSNTSLPLYSTLPVGDHRSLLANYLSNYREILQLMNIISDELRGIAGGKSNQGLDECFRVDKGDSTIRATPIQKEMIREIVAYQLTSITLLLSRITRFEYGVGDIRDVSLGALLTLSEITDEELRILNIIINAKRSGSLGWYCTPEAAESLTAAYSLYLQYKLSGRTPRRRDKIFDEFSSALRGSDGYSAVLREITTKNFNDHHRSEERETRTLLSVVVGQYREAGSGWLSAFSVARLRDFFPWLTIFLYLYILISTHNMYSILKKDNVNLIIDIPDPVDIFRTPKTSNHSTVPFHSIGAFLLLSLPALLAAAVSIIQYGIYDRLISINDELKIYKQHIDPAFLMDLSEARAVVGLDDQRYTAFTLLLVVYIFSLVGISLLQGEIRSKDAPQSSSREA